MGRWLGLLILALGLPGAAALANGRFPQTRTVTFKPGDDQKIWVGTTFGLLYSSDDGETWQWMCEQALGYTGIHDPIYAVTSQGTIYETIYDGLRISRDGGCTWNLAGNGLDGTWVSDIGVAADNAVWISTSTTANANNVYVSRDDGVTFAPTDLLRMRGYWKTLRVAPSDANRVYVTGYQMSEPADAMAQPTPLLFRTDNATEATVTWLEIPWSHGGESQLKLLGVSRADPDLVFARIDEVGNNTVFRSDDGGIGWNQVLSFTNADANAFVSSADGMTIVIGSDYGGAKISRNAGVTWEDLPGAPQMVCAGVRTADEEYFSCGANWEPDMMAFGKSSDLATFSSLFRFVAIDGPLDCPDSTPQGTECEPNWCMTCQMFGCPDPNCTPIGTDARVPDGGPGIGGDGGGGNGGGCGCAISDRGGLAGALLLVAGALALLRGVRRRRRR